MRDDPIFLKKRVEKLILSYPLKPFAVRSEFEPKTGEILITA